MNIVEWVWGLYGSVRILEAADERLDGDFVEEEMKCLMVVGCMDPLEIRDLPTKPILMISECIHHHHLL
ncbi:hypothetical protein Ahy_A03g011801 [Arachis hypogaea]|uniref:Uncharacterized protein n=1 Tax=Arachis hypogaea TaxID=3818 RepID=A0A445DRR3_ARAHY|nr:hypothetical protein Ahy_A03g011801 [Arachis hypogaea]